MTTVVLESPHRGTEGYTKEDADAYLDRCIADCIHRGESPYASHRMLTRVLDDDVPSDRDLGIQLGYQWYECVELVVFYEDLGWSEGMKKALAAVHALGVRYEVRRVWGNVEKEDAVQGRG